MLEVKMNWYSDEGIVIPIHYCNYTTVKSNKGGVYMNDLLLPNESDLITGKLISGMNIRRDKVNYYLDVAETISQNSTCLKYHYGAVIVDGDELISSGYMGVPRGRRNCIDIGCCYKDIGSKVGGCGDSMCRSVHAPINAIISASRRMMKGTSLYIVGINMTTKDYVAKPEMCRNCKMVIINSGIRDVYIRVDHNNYIRHTAMEWVDNDDTLL